MLTALLLELDPNPALGFVLQMFATGTAVGVTVAFVQRLRDRNADTWLISTGGALAGLTFGLIALLIDALT